MLLQSGTDPNGTIYQTITIALMLSSTVHGPILQIKLLQISLQDLLHTKYRVLLQMHQLLLPELMEAEC